MGIKQALLWIPIIFTIIIILISILKILGFSYSIYSNILDKLPTSCSYEQK